MFPQFNEKAGFGHVNLELGIEFFTLDKFRIAVKDFNIYLGRTMRWIKSDKVRFRSKCVSENYKWEI